jgi:hypothetical protein
MNRPDLCQDCARRVVTTDRQNIVSREMTREVPMADGTPTVPINPVRPTHAEWRIEMDFKSIFNRNGADSVRVPTIEVNGDTLRIPDLEGPQDPRYEPQGTRELTLPKTTWF